MQLAEEFGNDVEIRAIEDPCGTGNFEVRTACDIFSLLCPDLCTPRIQVVLDGQLIHSKATMSHMGHGRCQTGA